MMALGECWVLFCNGVKMLYAVGCVTLLEMMKLCCVPYQ